MHKHTPKSVEEKAIFSEEKKFFDIVPEGLPDPVFGLMQNFRQDPRPEKIDLLVGIYKDADLRATLMPIVAELKTKGIPEDALGDYLPIDGLPALKEGIGQLLFSPQLWAQEKGRLYAAQTIGGTGALRVAGEFFAHHVSSKIFIPDLGWPNHPQIFERAGLEVGLYPYFSRGKRTFDFDSMATRCKTIPEKSLVLLHASCHNPTGSDPTLEEWQKLSDLFHQHRLIPLFDCAYQGFGEGLEQDVQSVRLFLKEGHEMAIAYSCSKNFSLYRQRLGLLFMVAKTPSATGRIASQIKRIARASYSNPPAHGAYIAAEILQNRELKNRWERELSLMRARLHHMRQALSEGLRPKLSPDAFHALSTGKGMFLLFPFTPQEINRLNEEFGIYLLENGRLSLSGLTEQNLGRVQTALGLFLKHP